MISFDERRQRKLVLSEIRRNALALASLVGDDRYPRDFSRMHSWRGKIYLLTRLRRLERPLYLGSDGYIYRVDHVADYWEELEGHVRRAELKRRDLAGLARVNEVLKLAIKDILDKSPFAAGIVMEM